MLGTRFYKDNYNLNEYTACATWCNSNNATIVDMGEYYQCVSLPPPPILPIDDTPTLEERINDLELALIELAGGI